MDKTAETREKLEELFVEKLGYEFVGNSLAKPNIPDVANLIDLSIEYETGSIKVILAECHDQSREFQKAVIKHFKSQFPDSHFLFVSNQGKVFDLYNVSSSKKLKAITYNEIDRNTKLFEEKIQLFNVEEAEGTIDLKIIIGKAFETTDKITKKFYDKFRNVHDKLQKAISGIADENDRHWYASVLLNRLMFIYFLQKNYVIQNDTDYLLNQFHKVAKNEEDYYQDFLLPLFFLGFAKRDDEPSKKAFTNKYGEVRYLNGGLFYPHHIEKKYAEKGVKIYSEYKGKAVIDYVVPDIEVDADILEEILSFLNEYTWYLDNRPSKDDKDINPDVLGYIFEKYINQKQLGAYYTKEDITEYISKNTIIPFILDKLRKKGFDAPAPNPLITENKDIIQIFADFLEANQDPKLFKYLYLEVLKPLSVLDPSVGSGAFLFAALNILLPIYRKTIFKIRQFFDKEENWTKEIFENAQKNQEYWITKQIILNNLYGVDIVEEATEICKLRLFLQLASHLADVQAIEPLPDIDFNIYAGNSLVGGTSWEDLQANYTMNLFAEPQKIQKQIVELSKFKNTYRKAQQSNKSVGELKELKTAIERLETDINQSLDIGIQNPFHWFIEFDEILNRGGFDVIIGNPPYVEYSKIKKAKEYEIKGYQTEKAGNLYAFFIERIIDILIKDSRWAFILPISFACTKRMKLAQEQVFRNSQNAWFSYFAERPSKLFEGADLSLTIILSDSLKYYKKGKVFSSNYLKWNTEDREELFSKLSYCDTKQFLKDYSIPKLGSNLGKGILSKIYSNKKKIVNYIKKQGNSFVCYRNAGGRYYKIVLNSEPVFSVNGVQQRSSTYKFLHFENLNITNAICAIMNSSIFYWYWILYSDTWHMVTNDIVYFPIDLDNKITTKLSNINQELMEDFDRNSKESVEKRNKGKDDVILKKYFARKSKPIMDKIDKVLAEHYGFTEEELDYIINYDIEFRMGK